MWQGHCYVLYWHISGRSASSTSKLQHPIFLYVKANGMPERLDMRFVAFTLQIQFAENCVMKVYDKDSDSGNGRGHSVSLWAMLVARGSCDVQVRRWIHNKYAEQEAFYIPETQAICRYISHAKPKNQWKIYLFLILFLLRKFMQINFLPEVFAVLLRAGSGV